MTKRFRLLVALLILATTCFAQEDLTVSNKKNQKWPAADAAKIYLSACSVVQQEFGGRQPLHPSIKVVLGANANNIELAKRELRLVKWDPYLFAQGVVVFAFEDLMPAEDRLTITKRAVSWADATVEVGELRKQNSLRK
jgi:hypothetical protein